MGLFGFGSSGKDKLDALKKSLEAENAAKKRIAPLYANAIKNATSTAAKENAKNHKARELHNVQVRIDRIKKEIESCKQSMKK